MATTILFLCLVVCTITDLRVGLVFDWVILPALSVVIGASLLTHNVSAALLGALANGGAMFGLRLAAGKGSMGLGDVKLALVIGSTLGIVNGFIALGIAFVCGGALATILLVLRRVGPKTRIPFAPFLALGSAAAVALYHTRF